MKHVLVALVTLASASAFAHGRYHRGNHHHGYYGYDRGYVSAPHCPPWQNNVWGACLDKGAGLFNGWY